MPCAQAHYPFEDKVTFEQKFPADFIAEGLDQTRGWLYTLMVISTALFDKPPFQNLIVNGLVLAADGKKMSKRLKNYPDPLDVVHSHGADALRLFLVNSPVVKAESLRFREEGVRHVVRDVLLPWYHAFRFFTQEATRYEHGGKFTPSVDVVKASTNLMDRWIFAATQSLVKFTKEEMVAYRLYTVIPVLVNFLNQLTNWFVRLNRDRMRGSLGRDEATTSLSVLFEVLMTILRLMSPFTPYLTEFIYQNLKSVYPDGHRLKEDSVHFLDFPEANLEFIDKAIEAEVASMQSIVVVGRTLREKKKASLKTPLKDVVLVCPSVEAATALERLVPYVKEELNVMECTLSHDASLVQLTAIPNFRALGARLGKEMPKITKAIKALSVNDLEGFKKTNSIIIDGFELGPGDMTVQRVPIGVPNPEVLVDAAGDVVVMLNFEEDPALQQMATAREVANRVQKLRKELNLNQDDELQMYAIAKGGNMDAVLTQQEAYVSKCLRRKILLAESEEAIVVGADSKVLHSELFDIEGDKLQVVFVCDVKFRA